jgi:L-fuculose-phosphate aldolase
MIKMLMKEERQLIVEYGIRLVEANLTTGTGGNISIYDRNSSMMAISPSGINYYKTTPEDVVVMDLCGSVIEGDRNYSSEYLMHKILFENRTDINAVVHTHSNSAATLACLGWDLPTVHYLVGFAGGSVRCTEYKLFGSQELAEVSLNGIKDRYAVILGNHGLLAAGPDIKYAFNTAEEIEYCADLYLRSKAVGIPNILSEEQMESVLEKFKIYGQKEV